MLAYEEELTQEDDISLNIIMKLLKTGRLNEREPEEIKSSDEEYKFLWSLRS